MTEDVDFRSIDKLLYFVLSLLSLKLKEKRRFTWKIPGIRVPNYENACLTALAELQSLEQYYKRCSNCLCYALQINFCLQLLNIDYKAMKHERGFLAFLPKRSIADVNARTSFPFFSFPDSHFVGSSSTARERGNIDFERNGLVELS